MTGRFLSSDFLVLAVETLEMLGPEGVKRA
jgi:hypothetical protein